MSRPASHAWQLLFPPLQPHDGGWLDVGDGHALRYEVAGHPGAAAALVLHGGPGAGCSAHDRRWFDPAQWRIVTFDQRGSGRSRALRPLHANTTPHLVADIEALRRHLGVDRWLLFGGSWGSTLALAYAQQHPRRVAGLVLRGVFTATRAETESLYGPPLPIRLAAWHASLEGDGPAAVAAAHAWLGQEDALMAHETPHQPAARSDAEALRVARIQLHYARAGWFVAEGELLANAGRLRGIAGAIVQGAADRVTPPAGARALHAAWPQSRWHQITGAGHASGQPSMARALLDAIQTLAQTAPATTPQETVHG